MMKKVMVDGREITTNIGSRYSMCDGNDKKTMRLFIRKDYHETDEEMLHRLAKYGFTRITFYETSTMVKGYHNRVAYCK